MAELYLINDNVNSYQYVAACLIRFAHHLPIQAEQCCLITDGVGKCCIKTGPYTKLEELKYDLESMNLTVEIIAN